MKLIDKILGALHLNFRFLNRVKSPSIKVKKSTVKGDLVAGDKTIIRKQIDSSKKSLKRFEYLLKNSKWNKEFINHRETWICEDDNMYQIKIGYKWKDFTEGWTQVYPDKYGSHSFSVYLEINGVKIKDVMFISCDGARIRVPLPKIKMVNDKRIWYFDKKSLEYKLGKVIGEFYIYNNIKGIAKRSKIKII